MSQKEKVIGMGVLCASIGLFYLAINLWVCGSDNLCQGNIAKAITIDYKTDTEKWSGRNNPDFYINSPALDVSFPSVTPTNGNNSGDGDGGGGGGGGH